ncbi:unnamed protein product [Meloidogyne enterolobii]|uniref:Uncharacterized protein n=1 Tax=Meloidogyne enterolobii TaxID=390850 RepID=A0ACB0YS68_MELEN
MVGVVVESRSNVQLAAQVHEEYSGRLRIYSDIFKCLERNKKVEFRRFVLDVLNVSPQFCSITQILIFLDSQLSPILTLLSQTPSFGLAMSNNLQLQNMITRILERANTNSLFRIIEFIGSFLNV